MILAKKCHWDRYRSARQIVQNKWAGGSYVRCTVVVSAKVRRFDRPAVKWGSVKVTSTVQDENVIPRNYEGHDQTRGEGIEHDVRVAAN